MSTKLVHDGQEKNGKLLILKKYEKDKIVLIVSISLLFSRAIESCALFYNLIHIDFLHTIRFFHKVFIGHSVSVLIECFGLHTCVSEQVRLANVCLWSGMPSNGTLNDRTKTTLKTQKKQIIKMN